MRQTNVTLMACVQTPKDVFVVKGDIAEAVLVVQITKIAYISQVCKVT